MLKTCLYDDGVLNIRDMLREGQDDTQIQNALIQALGKRAKNGWEAEKNRKEKNPVHESMATIGG
jgi:cyclic pyranopterin phosphate synthase